MASDVQSAFYEGCTALASGERRAANPYPPNTALWGGWQRGWMHEYRRLPEPLQRVRCSREPEIVEPDPERG